MQFYTPQQDRSDKRLEVLTDRLLASMIIGVELMIILLDHPAFISEPGWTCF